RPTARNIPSRSPRPPTAASSRSVASWASRCLAGPRPGCGNRATPAKRAITRFHPVTARLARAVFRHAARWTRQTSQPPWSARDACDNRRPFIVHMPMPRELVVTCALPYANGPLHLGRLVGYVQGDIFARAQRLSGNAAHFVCADDTHGTPIMLAAEKAGMTPETYIAGIQASHERDFADFGVAFDHYDSTNSPRNRALTEAIYAKLDNNGHIKRRSVAQLYDPAKGMFLPDRFVKGTCPNCGTPDQYGDNCEHCGATYAPTELKQPRSVISGATPELRESE